MNGREIQLIKELLQIEIKSVVKELDLLRQDNREAHSFLRTKLEDAESEIQKLNKFKTKILVSATLLSAFFTVALNIILHFIGR